MCILFIYELLSEGRITMKKTKVISILVVIVMIFSFIGCNDKSNVESLKDGEKRIVKVFVPEGVPSISIAKLIKEKPEVKKNYEVVYETINSTDNLVSKVLNKEADIAIVPSNLPAQAFNKGLDYKICGTVGWGNLYLLSTENVDNISQLKGKEIYNIGRGLTPDIVSRYVMKNNNIDPDNDLTLTYLNGATEIAPAFISGKAKTAIMPEPMITNVLSKKEDAKIGISINDEWKKITDSKYGYPQSTLIVRDELLKDHEKFVMEFMNQINESILWANSNPEQLGEYAEELKMSITKDMAPTVMKRANLNFINIKDCKDEYRNFYKVLEEYDAKSIGGKIPDEAIYFK